MTQREKASLIPSLTLDDVLDRFAFFIYVIEHRCYIHNDYGNLFWFDWDSVNTVRKALERELGIHCDIRAKRIFL
jgi:hypothetical protein